MTKTAKIGMLAIKRRGDEMAGSRAAPASNIQEKKRKKDLTSHGDLNGGDQWVGAFFTDEKGGSGLTKKDLYMLRARRGGNGKVSQNRGKRGGKKQEVSLLSSWT